MLDDLRGAIGRVAIDSKLLDGICPPHGLGRRLLVLLRWLLGHRVVAHAFRGRGCLGTLRIRLGRGGLAESLGQQLLRHRAIGHVASRHACRHDDL
jgi:hypothetical protein